MASINFDSSSGWWSVKFLPAKGAKRVKKNLCKHPGSWSAARPPKRPPDEAVRLAQPFVAAERLAKLGQAAPGLTRTPLRDYLTAYRDRAGLGHAAKTRDAVRIATDKFCDYCEGRGVKHLQDVTYGTCRDWIAHRLKEGAQRSTVVTERSNLTPAWTQAVRERIVTENPWPAALVPGKPRKEVPTAWTRGEVDALLGELKGWTRDAVLLGVNTGIRITALLGLRWEQVDWAAGLIRVRAADSKSGRPYEVPISEAARTMLQRRMGESPTGLGLIFPNPQGKPYQPRTTFTTIKRAVRRAGVPDYGDYNHVLRRTFATIALNSGIPLEIVSRCLDHATLAQTQRAYSSLLAHRLIEGMKGFSVGG